MRSIKGSLVGLVLAGILALAPTAAFAHGGGGGGFGGGGHGGGFSGGGGHFAGGGGHFVGGGGHFAGDGGHFVGGGGHFAGFAGHSFTGHSFVQHQGEHFARHEDHFRHHGHWYGYPYYGYDYPYYGYDYPYYGYYDDNAGDYYDGQYSPAEVTPSQETIIAVQKELTQLGYYRGQVDGLIGPQTERAIRWFQSVDKIPVTGQLDDPTLKALRIS
jgi:Putative peptidoglycan binding domain